MRLPLACLLLLSALGVVPCGGVLPHSTGGSFAGTSEYGAGSQSTVDSNGGAVQVFFALHDAGSASEDADVHARAAVGNSPSGPERRGERLLPASGDRDQLALAEMLRGAKGQVQRWSHAPELVVLTSVMEYHTGEVNQYTATAERLTDDEVNGLAADLTGALVNLTDHTFEQFAAIRRQSIAEGAKTNVVRRGQIVVGRYRGVRRLSNTIGLGGRSSQSDGTIIGGAMVLDEDYDRTSNMRRLLRTHELGHALGYNHVQSQISIMNPRIGPELTDFDRKAAAIAFQNSRERALE